MDRLPEKDEEQIIEKTVDGWNLEEIGYYLRKEQDSPLQDSTIQEWIAQDEVQQKIELEKSIQEKRAEVSRDELLRELRNQKEILHEQSERLREKSKDEISNDTVSNLIKTIQTMADMIDVLETKDESGGANVININNLEQNFDITKSVKYLSKEDKKSVVEQLEDDDDVEDFAVIRKKDEGEEKELKT